METQEQLNYRRIEQAISFIIGHFKEQPSLEEIAAQVHMSPSHFQRLFSDWAGTSPKKFLQYISIEHAKKVLSKRKANLLETSLETGLSSTSRLHEMFLKIKGMTPAEYKNGGANLTIRYSFPQSHFGMLLIASTDKGICHMAFTEDKTTALQLLSKRFPAACLMESTDEIQQSALRIFGDDWRNMDKIKLHIRGTDFQLKVWESLLKIPIGSLTSYGDIASQIGNPRASRAVGTAVGNNPVAYLIPCHRVIQSSGILGNYMWGGIRKTALIGWEQSRLSDQH